MWSTLLNLYWSEFCFSFIFLPLSSWGISLFSFITSMGYFICYSFETSPFWKVFILAWELFPLHNGLSCSATFCTAGQVVNWGCLLIECWHTACLCCHVTFYLSGLKIEVYYSLDPFHCLFQCSFWAIPLVIDWHQNILSCCILLGFASS